MTYTAKALNLFFSRFGLPAFTENNVPEELEDANGVLQKVQPPYITYQQIEPSWRSAVPMYARVWYRGSNNVALDAKVDEIAAAIGEGVGIATPGGLIYLNRGDTFAQYQEFAGDPTLKCAYLSLTLQALTV